MYVHICTKKKLASGEKFNLFSCLYAKLMIPNKTQTLITVQASCPGLKINPKNYVTSHKKTQD